MIRYILTDIEGTTTAISFVHDVLFPYSAARMPAWVEAHRSQLAVQAALAQVTETVHLEEGILLTQEGQVQRLLQWIQEDRKHGGLKTLQGLLWKEGYEAGAYRGHVYPDVPPALKRWKQRGLDMGVYSSGSVEAQQLLFGYSDAGDLRPYFSHYFDTSVGHKRQVASYLQIQRELDLPAASILFLSDVPQELDAAGAAGLRTTQLVRPGTLPTAHHPVAPNFDEILP